MKTGRDIKLVQHAPIVRTCVPRNKRRDEVDALAPHILQPVKSRHIGTSCSGSRDPWTSWGLF